jgi:hypothetical protein
VKEGIRVVVLDHATGNVETVELPRGEYLILTTAPCFVSSTQAYPKKGTHVLTVKGRTAGRKT